MQLPRVMFLSSPPYQYIVSLSHSVPHAIHQVLSLWIVVLLAWSFQYFQLFCFLQLPANSMEATSELVGGTVQYLYISMINKHLGG